MLKGEDRRRQEKSGVRVTDKEVLRRVYMRHDYGLNKVAAYLIQ
jgi:hypothetical protein